MQRFFLPPEQTRGELLTLITNGSPGGSRVWSYDGRWTRKEDAPPIRNLQPTASGPDGTIYFFQSWDESLQSGPTLHVRAPDGTWSRTAGEGAGGKGSQAAAWDHHRRRLVLFGGRVGRGMEVNETWEFDGMAWVRHAVN